MRIIVVARPQSPLAAEVAGRIRRAADELGVEVTDGDAAPGDVMVAVGGDGTVLHALGAALEAGIAVLGINVGTVGFLAEVLPDDAEEAVARLAAGRYTETTRMTAAVEGPAGSVTVFNDVVLRKADASRAFQAEVSISGEKLTVFRADGVVVATPTGSTAYAFSAGGPVVDPSMEAFVIVPVAPHNLFGRPVVASAGDTITMTLVGRPGHLDVDGIYIGEVAAGQTVTIQRGSRPARFVTLTGDGFLSVLRARFGIAP